DYGEQALEIADMLVRSGAVDLIVVDSVAALVPKAEIEGDMGDSHVGLQARLMSQALRKLTASVAKSNTMMFFTNQIRMKIGVMFGSPETTTGGQALKFYASVRLDVRRIGAIKEAGKTEAVVVGNRTKVKVVKNKMAAPFREIEFDIIYGKGVSRSGEIVDMAAEAGIIQKSGAWYSYGADRIGQGRENARQYLEENPSVMEKIAALVLAQHGIGADAAAAAAAAAGDDKGGKQQGKGAAAAGTPAAGAQAAGGQAAGAQSAAPAQPGQRPRAN
ncbi:MAG TPA: recombinase RecA, partial [Polyangiaceae bacterium]|nr:recombinase RecA [Polyangiaceae bacterium]